MYTEQCTFRGEIFELRRVESNLVFVHEKLFGILELQRLESSDSSPVDLTPLNSFVYSLPSPTPAGANVLSLLVLEVF